MTQDKEAFLDRWSRLKREQPAPAPEHAEVAKADEQPAPPLQPVEELKPESDFTPFMKPKVDPATRRSALKKLFTDAHFNVPDPFEAYSEDYTISEPIPMEMLKAINRARDVAVKGPEQVAEEERLAEEARARAQTEPEQAGASPSDATQSVAKLSDTPTQKEGIDVPGRQDA